MIDPYGEIRRRSRLRLVACSIAVLFGACGAPAPPPESPAGEPPAPAAAQTRTRPEPAASAAPAPAQATVTAPKASLAAMKEHALAVQAYGAEPPSRCGLEEPRGAVSGPAVKVYFGCTPRSGPVVAAVPARSVAVPPGQEPERVALEALLAGPDDRERQAGYVSNFGAASRGVAFDSEIHADGTAVVNFDQAIRDQAHAFVSNLDARQVVATLSQFPGVKRVLILVEGEPLCRALGEC